MALFEGKKKAPLSPPVDPRWFQNKSGQFPNFLNLDPEAVGLSGVSAVFAIWHAGPVPGWVYFGASQDLAKTFHELGENENILEFSDRDNLYCSWCLIREELQPGVVAFLTLATKPKVTNPEALTQDEVDLVSVWPPGMVPDEEKTNEEKLDQQAVTRSAAVDAIENAKGKVAAAVLIAGGNDQPRLASGANTTFTPSTYDDRADLIIDGEAETIAAAEPNDESPAVPKTGT